MGHADIKTTMVYTHYALGANEAELVNGGFQPAVAQPNPVRTFQGRTAKKQLRERIEESTEDEAAERPAPAKVFGTY